MPNPNPANHETPPAPAELLPSLRERLNELADLDAATALLSWDQETMLPSAGIPMRADQLATLERVRHDRLVAPEVGEWLAALPPEPDAGAGDQAVTPIGEPSVAADRDAAIVRVTRRDRDKALRVPGSLLAELARAGSLGSQAWAKARATDDFATLLPHLRDLVALRRRYIECFPEVEHPYDALLDDYEPGMRTAQVRSIFGQLRDGLVALLAAIAAAREAGAAPVPLRGPFPADAQRRLVSAVLTQVGFDPERFRLDESAHPFSSGTSLNDQRITVRFGEESLESLFAGLHEFGHALYEAQIDAAFARTPLCAGVSLSLHESQSRLWENMVGRSRPFAIFVLPALAEAFPERFGEFDAAQLHRSVNTVRPSPIRVQADEVSYALHIILRFELEVELFEGTLEPEQLPLAWRERMRSYLGVEVADDASGVLQDPHWSFGDFGYFPTYALGNLVAAQLWERIGEDLPALDERIAAGDFAPLREWLAQHVHRYGRMFTPAQTLRRSTGADLDPAPFLAYLWTKHADVHGARRG